MFVRLKQIAVGALLGFLIPAVAFGQTGTATLLPNAVQQYLDQNGNPVSAGTVDYYIPSTTTRKTTWSSSTESVGTQNPNPVLLSAGGFPQNGAGAVAGTYGDGLYRQVVKDQDGNTIWDLVTSSTGSSGGGTAPAYSEGVMVGTIIPWASTTLPGKYLYTAGQTVSRTTYAQLLSALTYSFTVSCQATFATISVTTAISDSVPIGAPIEAACFAPGTTVANKSSGQLTMSNPATTTISTSAVLFPWGNGNASTTFNLPDLRGRTIAGRDNMNNSGAGRLSTSFYGTNPDAVNASGGFQNFQIKVDNLPTINSAGINSYSVTPGGGGTGVPATSTPANVALAQVSSGTGTFVPSSTSGNWAGVTSWNGTSSFSVVSSNTNDTPIPTIQPTVTSDYIIKALPDDTPGGPGVTSINGMTGAISCGANLVCNSQTISVTIPANVTSIGGMQGVITCGAGITCTSNSITTSASATCTTPITGTYTVQTSDNGCTIVATGGPYTVTLPAVTGFSSSPIQLCNANPNSNTGRAIKISGFPNLATPRLWMGQCLTVRVTNGAWVTTHVPGYFRPSFIPSFFIDTGGNNNNDGLISNAAGNAIADLQTCFTIIQNEMDIIGGPPSCLLTAGAIFSGPPINYIRGHGYGIVNIFGNGGIATLRTTGNVVLEMYDFSGYIISANVQYDCSFGTHPCIGFFLHQQNGVDFGSAAPANFPNYFNGGNNGDTAIWCDGQCKVNSAQPIFFTGAWNIGLQADLSSVFSILNGINDNASFASNVIQITGGSQLLWSGTATFGGSNSAAKFLFASNLSVARFASFSTSGTIGGSAVAFQVINGAIVCNAGGTGFTPNAGSTGTTSGGAFAGLAAGPSAVCGP